jgi:hypothetical protein
VSATYVVKKAGETTGASYTIEASRIARLATIEDLWRGTSFFPDSWNDFPSAAFVPALPGLEPGSYQADISLELSAQFCDGIDPDPDYSCLPAGTTYLFAQSFTVVPRPEDG